jgi:hypothetical protein
MPRWTDAARARQAALIVNWKPWAASTGPRTVAGKVKAARNADKGGEAGKTLRLEEAQRELAAAMVKVERLSRRLRRVRSSP